LFAPHFHVPSTEFLIFDHYLDILPSPGFLFSPDCSFLSGSFLSQDSLSLPDLPFLSDFPPSQDSLLSRNLLLLPDSIFSSDTRYFHCWEKEKVGYLHFYRPEKEMVEYPYLYRREEQKAENQQESLLFS